MELFSFVQFIRSPFTRQQLLKRFHTGKAMGVAALRELLILCLFSFWSADFSIATLSTSNNEKVLHNKFDKFRFTYPYKHFQIFNDQIYILIHVPEILQSKQHLLDLNLWSTLDMSNKMRSSSCGCKNTCIDHTSSAYGSLIFFPRA